MTVKDERLKLATVNLSKAETKKPQHLLFIDKILFLKKLSVNWIDSKLFFFFVKEEVKIYFYSYFFETKMKC